VKEKIVAALIILAGSGVQIVGGAAFSSNLVFILGSAVVGFGLYRWSLARGSSKYIIIGALIPFWGPAIGMLVSPASPSVPLTRAVIELRAGLVIAFFGIIASMLAAEPGIAVLMFGLSLALASLRQGPEHKTWRVAVVFSAVLIGAGLVLVRPWLGPGSLW